MFEIGSQKRTFIAIESIPKPLIQAFISAEDKTFYQNQGVDLIGLGKIAILDVYKIFKGEKIAGASTITQQVVRNIMLTNERTVSRKLKEFILSYELTKRISKDKIMEIYLNHIYLGMQSYGIAAAADEYFGKTVDRLALHEMAMLAALPKAPSTINPFKNAGRAVARRNWVLKRMLEEGYINNLDYEHGIAEELVVKRKVNAYNGMYAPSFFAQSVLLKNKELGVTEDKILNGGYNVYLTIDKNLQVLAQEALDKGLQNYSKRHGFAGPIFKFGEPDLKHKDWIELLKSVDEPDDIGKFRLAIVLSVSDDKVKIGLNDKSEGFILLQDLSWARAKISEISVGPVIKKCQDVLSVGDVVVVSKNEQNHEYFKLEQIPKINGGVVVLDPRTSEVLAMVGGYLDTPGGFNRASQAYRQVGSAIKPFIYATALENKITPADLFMDADISMNIGDGVMWTPKNHTKQTKGPVTVRTGLERSLNTITIRLADRVGISKIRDSIIAARINPDPQRNLSIVLGSLESSLLDLVNAYSVFTNGGVIKSPYLINNVISGTSEKISDKIFLQNIPSISVVDDVSKSKPETDKVTSPDIVTDAVVNLDRVFSPETSYQMISMLEGAVLHGTAHDLAGLGIDIAAKSGTSDKGRDMWTIAQMPELTIGAYVGYDQPIDTESYGSQFAMPIVKDIIMQLKNKISFTSFKVPDGIKFVKVASSNGKRTNRAVDGRSVIYEVFKESDIMPQQEDILEESGKNYDISDIDGDR